MKTLLITIMLLPYWLVAQDCPVTVHMFGDPDRLNPLTSTSANATYIQNQLFSKLLEYDAKTLELKPQMAVAMPEVELIKEGKYKGGMSLRYEIRAEAMWDNGEPVTAADYVFTMKALKVPSVNSGPQRPYYEFVDEIKIDDQNPKRFTVYSKKTYFLAESATGDFFVMPEYIYDKKQILRGFSLSDLNDPQNLNKLTNNKLLKEFAKDFNSVVFDRETVVGSGAYRFSSWETGNSVVLERKADWWGDKAGLVAYPQKIVYKVITDITTANTAMREGYLDVLAGIKPDAYKDLEANEAFTAKFELSSPMQYAYYYIGFNMKNEKLQDPALRLALSHLVNRDEIISDVFQGMATKTNSPISPLKSYYNKTLPDIEFDVEKAKELLAAAGWADSDADGVLDKKIGGEKVDLKLEYMYNQGNSIRKNIGLLLKDAAQQVGIEIELVAREWTVFLENIKRRDFEMICLAWVQGPSLDDLKQIWHRDSDTPDGSNRVGFGDKETDALIDEIRMTLDETKRNELYQKIQQKIYDAHPYVFICVPTERIAISKRFGKQETSILRPGFDVNLMRCE